MEIPSSPLTPRLPDAKLWRATVGDVVEALESTGQSAPSPPGAPPDDVVVLRDATPAAQLSAALRNEPIRPPILPLPPSPALDPPGPSHADVAAARGTDMRGPVPADDAPPLPLPLRFAADAARASLAAGRPMPALALLDAAWPASHVPAELHALRAQGLLDVGRETESAEVVARGLAQSPESSALRWLGVQAAVRLEAPEHAAALAMPLLRQVPDAAATVERAPAPDARAAAAPDETSVPAKARTALRVMAQVVVAMGTPAVTPDAVIIDASIAADPEVIDVEVVDAEVVSSTTAPEADQADATAPAPTDADESPARQPTAGAAQAARTPDAASTAPNTASTVLTELRADAPSVRPQGSPTDARARVDAATTETRAARDVANGEAAAPRAVDDHPRADGAPQSRADAAPPAPASASDARRANAPEQSRADRPASPVAESAVHAAPHAAAVPTARIGPTPTERPARPPALAEIAPRAAASKPATSDPAAERTAAPGSPRAADAPAEPPPPRSVLFEQRRAAVLTALERVFGPAERRLFVKGEAIRAVERWLAPPTLLDPALQAAARSRQPDVAALPHEVQLRLLQVGSAESTIVPLPAAVDAEGQLLLPPAVASDRGVPLLAAPHHDLVMPSAPSHSTELALRPSDAQLPAASAEPVPMRLDAEPGAAPPPRAEADARAALLTPPPSDPSTLFAWLAVDARLQPAGVLAAQWRRAGEGAVLQAVGAAAAARRSPLPVSWQGVLRLALVGAAIVSAAVGRSSTAVLLGATAVVWWMQDGRRR